jgi:hypothetical protein
MKFLKTWKSFRQELRKWKVKIKIDSDKEKLNHLIKEKTSFENWDEMLSKAFIERVTRKLQL